jgi:hypothetical protein
MITIFHAIHSLVPDAEVSVGMYDQTVTWHQPETAPVTPEQIQEEQQRLQQAYDWAEYQRNRAREYPTVQEQLDALYHAGVFPAEMAARIRAVKAKYPRYSADHAQTAEQTTTPTMSVDEWLAQETKMSADEWLAQQQQSNTSMTREQWLASQVEVKTVHSATPTNLVTVTRTMTTEEWLREQTVSPVNNPAMTREQWLEQQKQQDQPRKLTREEWLAEQANLGN